MWMAEASILLRMETAVQEVSMGDQSIERREDRDEQPD
jgi:hypothetical protein